MVLELPIPLNQDYEYRVFNSRKIDEDCDTIGDLAFDENYLIIDLVQKGEYNEAAMKYLQLTKSMCRHFIMDEHWTYFDDFYSPGYALDYLTDYFNVLIEKGTLPEDVVSFMLKAWKEEILESECYQGYGYPSSVLGQKRKRSLLSDVISKYNKIQTSRGIYSEEKDKN